MPAAAEATQTWGDEPDDSHAPGTGASEDSDEELLTSFMGVDLLEGTDLLSLPEDILQNIAVYFDLAEWVRGPAQACRLLHHMALPSVVLTYGMAERGMAEDALVPAGNQISYALACAGRHIGPCTKCIGVDMQATLQSLVKNLGQPGSLTSPSVLANVVSLSLSDLSGLYGDTDAENHEDAGTGQFASMLLHRLPNLIAARLWYMTSEVFFMPLSQLKYLDLIVKRFSSDVVPVADYFPELKTARIAADVPCMLPELDFSGCKHLTRLVLDGIMVSRLSTPPQCRVSFEMCACHPTDLRPGSTRSAANQLRPDVSEVNEVLLDSYIFYPFEFFAKVCWPKLEFIRCVWIGCAEDDFEYPVSADQLVHWSSRNASSFPALKSIICAEVGQPKPSVMKACIPADLAGIQELIFATHRPLELSFDNACSAGFRLRTFCAVASEVRFDPGALRDVNVALSGQGLTLSMAQAGQEHEFAPSQCLYLRALSEPELSYEIVICAVNERVGKWGRHHGCACGACLDCLVGEGILGWE